MDGSLLAPSMNSSSESCDERKKNNINLISQRNNKISTIGMFHIISFFVGYQNHERIPFVSHKILRQTTMSIIRLQYVMTDNNLRISFLISGSNLHSYKIFMLILISFWRNRIIIKSQFTFYRLVQFYS